MEANLPKLENGWLFQSASINQNTEFPVERTLHFPLTRVTAALLSAPHSWSRPHVYLLKQIFLTLLCYCSQGQPHFFKRFFLFFRERKGRRKRERNIDWLSLVRPQLGIWPATQACALTGIWTSSLSVHRQAFNPLSEPARAATFFRACK